MSEKEWTIMDDPKREWPNPLTRRQMQRVMNLMLMAYPMLPRVHRIPMVGTIATAPELECWAHRDKP